MDSGIPRKSFTKASLAAIAATLLLSAGWSAVAHGATNSVVRCNKEARELTSLNVSREALSADRVDLVTNESEPASLEAQSSANDANAPLLYLTPRVANLLRDVFQTTGDEAPVTATDELPSSPLADSVNNRLDENDFPDKSDDIPPAISVEEEILPRFQQQMYRKDI